MNKSVRTAISLAIPLALAACGGSNTSSTKPSEPEPLKPGLSYPVETEIGDVTLVGTSESVVVLDTGGTEQKVRIESFKGIPYAEATRFNHSETVALEDGYATEFGAVCPQTALTDIRQSEECLNLNIWRPSNLDADQQVPVYVFIHGGNFENGAGSDPHIHGDNVVAQGQLDGQPFIAVTFNYRLGLLGSTYTDDRKGGNFGIGDQKRALEWVHDNIEKFGGDAGKVTLMGQGAGAMSIGILQQASSEDFVAEKYFQRAIMQSNPYGFEYKSSSNAKSFATVTEMENMSLKEIMDKQQSMSKATSKVVDWVLSSAGTINPISSNETPISSLMPFAPYIEYRLKYVQEGYHFKSQPFDTELTVPTVAGFNAADDRTFGALADITFLIPMVVDLIMNNDPELLVQDDAAQTAEAIASWLKEEENVALLQAELATIDANDVNTQLDLSEIINLLPETAYEAVTTLFYGLGNTDETKTLLGLEDYVANSEQELSGALDNMKQFNQMTNDMMFAGPIRNKVAAAQDSQIQATMYEFNYRGSFNSLPKGNLFNEKETDLIQVVKSLSCSFGTPCFGSELPFVFNKAVRSDGTTFSVSDSDEAMMSKMSRVWFSDELFEKEQYQKGLDNVWVIDGSGAENPINDWDRMTKGGDDLLLQEGRLQGLEDQDLIGYYLVD
ncbi:carboxylesterase family protein [Vibrio variabilis]|uniref:carboxylesterase family protein n=1 Tax=Vibrio variabilis TaxID=990271 RepID=UPI000DDBCCC9|nr:carboxylesterase family protein [Vibrio variabilis]